MLIKLTNPHMCLVNVIKTSPQVASYDVGRGSCNRDCSISFSKFSIVFFICMTSVSGNLADCVNDCSCKNYDCSSVETAFCNKIDKGIVDWKCDCKPCDVISNDNDHDEESDETEDVINSKFECNLTYLS